MRSSLLYGVILLCCLIISTVQADKKWKVYETEDDKIRKVDDDIRQKKLEKVKTNKNRISKLVNTGSSEESDEENYKKSANKVETDSPKKGKGKKPEKQVDESSSSEETFSSKRDPPPPQKKFIGRIEHGKVMVLRIKENSTKTNNISNQSEEDHKAKVCRKTKSGQKMDCENSDAVDRDESNEEDNENKSKKKIKYSIKFQHEKQKKKENSGDIGIMRMHKNGKRYGKHDDDEDKPSDEDDSPIKKRINYDDDD